MKRRILSFAALATFITFAALATPARRGLLLLDWAVKAPSETPPVSILLEMGLQKAGAKLNWSGRATVRGARVISREGFHFVPGDRLVEPDAWKVGAGGKFKPKKAPGRSIGILLTLADVQQTATITVVLDSDTKKATDIPLAQLLTGKHYTLWKGNAVARLVSTPTPITATMAETDFPAACYGPDGTLWVCYIAYTVRDESWRHKMSQFLSQPKNFQQFYQPEFADQLVIRYRRGSQWSTPVAVTGPKEDLVRCAVAAEGNGTVWVVYSAHRQGNFDLFARPIHAKLDGPADQRAKPAVGPERRLTSNALPDLDPVLCTGPDGHVYGSFQSWQKDAGGARVRATTGHWLRCRDGKWEVLDRGAPLPEGNEWYPAVASGPRGCAVAHDIYRGGDYDVRVSEWNNQERRTSVAVAASDRFEARPSLAYDAEGRLWIAYEEGPEKWGKDYGTFINGKGDPLFSNRAVRVVCLVNGKLYRPVAQLPSSQITVPKGPRENEPTFVRGARYSCPRIGIDGKGRLWVTYRQNVTQRLGTLPRWVTFARRLDGDHWSEPIELSHSDGLIDNRAVLLPHKNGGLLMIHSGDERGAGKPGALHSAVYMNHVDLPGPTAEPKLVPHDPGRKAADPLVDREAEAIKRMRAYRAEAGGKKYRLLRGEFHRHTDLSFDGYWDGSLEDMFRYALDTADLDWVGNGDHDSGGREYSWWVIQKFTDAFHLPGSFTTMFTYERSVQYPMGHRNCMFAKRGVRPLTRLRPVDRDEAVGGVDADDTKMLYRYLHELDGICASHTSVSLQGTDWRDNDPKVEPFVELYQGARTSYEYEGAPRAGYDPQSGKEPVNLGGWYPKGFVDRALAKGYRLGFQSSSDHVSTHISYCILLSEKDDRDSLLAAAKLRHCYGATDNIILDVRSGKHLQGDEFKTNEATTLQITVVGTGKLAKIDVLRDSEVVATLKAKGQEYHGTWTDPAPQAGTHYYYVRVLQEDGEIAWASPMWITR